jgi:hypothetical protein
MSANGLKCYAYLYLHAQPLLPFLEVTCNVVPLSLYTRAFLVTRGSILALLSRAIYHLVPGRLESNRPWVERKTPCRDESIVWGSQVSPSQVYEVMVSVPLFFSRFSTSILVALRKYRGLGHAVDGPVDGVESRFSCSPLLYHECRPVSKFRANSTKILLRKNIVPSFEDTEYKETYTPRLSRQRGAHKKPSLDKDSYNVVSIVTLVVSYYILYSP